MFNMVCPESGEIKMIKTEKIISGKENGLFLQQKQHNLCLSVTICGKNQLFIL
jgi:hypothetical protein